MKILIDSGANIDALTKNLGTPLHLSVQKQNIEIVKILIERGANINALTNDLWTPLHLAV